MSRLLRFLRIFFWGHYQPFFVQWEAFLSRDGDVVLEVHRHATRVAWSQYPRPARCVLFAASLVVWPLHAAWLILQYTRLAGKSVAERYGKDRLRQAIEQAVLALRYSIPPYEYYAYNLFVPANWQKANRYFHEYEVKHLFAFLNQYRSVDVLNDKVKFAAICSEHNLKTAPLVAELEGGQVSVTEENLPFHDLFIKPVEGSKGRGAMLLEYLGNNAYRDPEGNILSSRELIEALLKLSKHIRYLVQPRIFAASEISDLTTGALPTVRIVTAFTGSGIQAICAVFKMPTGAMISDFDDREGLVSPIDLTTGRIGSAVTLALTWQQFVVHPDTGAPITGRMLPYWPCVLDLAKRAHHLFRDYVFIGWDVAITDEGPLLLEGNVYWSTRLMQIPHNRPLGDMGFAEICVSHLKHGRTQRTLRSEFSC